MLRSMLIEATHILFAVAWCTQCERPGRPEPRLQTEWSLRELHSAIVAFRAAAGTWPQRVTDICHRDESRCGSNWPTRWGRDGWGHEIRYNATRDGFEIRSAGPDGRFATGDDLLVREPDDRSDAGRLAGCFDAREGWFPGAPTLVVLDTSSGTIRPYSGGYLLRLAGLGNKGEAEWYPLGKDSVVLRWVAGEALPAIRMTAVTDTMRGHVDLLEGTWRGNVVLVRVSCD